MNDIPDTKKSKCFTCKFGICVKQKQETHIIPMQQPPGPPKEPWEADSENDNNNVTLKDSGHFALCFWPSLAMKEQLPLQVGYVEECNRYEEEIAVPKKVAKSKK